MFMTVVSVLLTAVLILASGCALHMGVFKAHRTETGFLPKALGGIVSYGFSAAAWLTMYSYNYLNW